MRSCLYNLKRAHASKLIGLIGTAGGLTILLAFPIGKSEPATPTIKVPVNPGSSQFVATLLRGEMPGRGKAFRCAN